MRQAALGLVLILSLLAGELAAESARFQNRDTDRFHLENRLAEDPCLHTRHTEINDPRRRISFFPSDFDSALDDQQLPENWYRFTSGAGGIIPTWPPIIGSCGTIFPIWMDGSIPNDDGQEHVTKMCMASYTNTKYRCHEVKIKNCTDFLVYRLVPALFQKTAYCAGTGSPCGPHQTSPTGFTPCEHVDSVPTEPRAPEVRLNENFDAYFFLECHLKQPDVSVIHDVRWIAGGNIFHTQTLQPGESFARLHEDDMRFRKRTILGYHVSCEVSARKRGVSLGSKFTISEGQGYFLGLQFIDLRGNEVRELDFNDEFSKTLYLRSTVPVRCNSRAWLSLPSFLRRSCQMSVIVRNSDLSDFVQQLSDSCTSHRIRVKQFVSQLHFSDCAYDLNKENWKHTIPYDIALQVENTEFQGQQSIYVDFDVRASYQEIWDTYQPPYIKVIIKDSEVPPLGRHACQSKSSQVTTFDGRKYDVGTVGELVLYQHAEYNLRVHVFWGTCRRDNRPCVCGVAAQAGDDVILFERCYRLAANEFTDLPQAQENRFLRQKVFARGRLTPGFSLEHLTGTHEYVIRFPHGAELHIGIGSEQEEQMDLTLVPSQNDYAASGRTQKVHGLCGTYSGRIEDDLVKHGGSLYISNPTDYRRNRFFPNNFTESWRIPPRNERSLYNGQIVDKRQYPPVTTCACLTLTSESTEQIVCPLHRGCHQTEDLTELIARRIG